MKEGTRRGRLALLAVAVAALAAIVAMPATALAAKATTRIVVAKTMTVDNGQQGVDAWETATLTAKLQRKVNGSYRSYSGYVKLYKYDEEFGTYDYKGRMKSSAPSFSLYAYGRGKYKLRFEGTSTTKSCTAYTAVYELIGESISDPVVSWDLVEGTTWMMNVQYTVDWNTDAWSGPVALACDADFRTLDEFGDLDLWDAWTTMERVVWAPRTVEFNYKVDESEILDYFYTAATTSAVFDDGYIFMPTESKMLTPMVD